MLTMPLITGSPLWGRERNPTDPLATRLGVSNYVVVPIINKKRVNCWEETQCGNADCPAYGKKLVRCWEMPELDCKECEARQGHCPVFRHQNIETMEGVILADNTPSGNFIQREAVTALTIITHAVGLAINNSKNYKRAVSDSVRDPLTLLHNRRFFNEHILDEIDRSNRYNDPFSLIMCDIDHFKNVNDKYGHPFGDQVLMWVAKMLREKCRRTDVVARYGGEEFTILLTNADKAEAARVAEHLRRAFDETPFLHEDAELKITLSFGAASFPADADTSESLIRLADKALYLAKEAGRNRIHVA
jgi:diguanylate cyclase (GGDEF)-like protein